ncbi:MAG: DUF2203 domain-containing protein [Acidobacteria bacterium]|nr:MAG: DUF2203 domain-containing protein [Acidobacteriota bacterium]
MSKKTFSYEDAVALLPRVQRETAAAVDRVNELPDDDAEAQELVVMEWAESILGLGVEVKGLWLVDFDNGGGYYCWRYPEPALEYFHGYEEGFGGRVKLN